MFIAPDIDTFKQIFTTQLKAMLADDQLGAFILVLANSLQDTDLKKALSADLNNNFIALKKQYLAGSLDAPQDDLEVFQQLLAIALESLPVWQIRKTGNWEIVYNIMRQLRPARASGQTLSSIRQPFDKKGFHFNKPFLEPEILWQGEYLGQSLRVLYNKFPFAPYHLLIALDAESEQSQMLGKSHHLYVSTLVNRVANTFPGFGIGYNSLAAGASVNHLHFQGFIRDAEFAIEKACWSHNGQKQAYPVNIKCFSDAEKAWEYIDWLIKEDQAFNCLYRAGSCFVAARPYQGTVPVPGWLDGAGWIDIAGVMTVSDENTFKMLDEKSVTSALSLLKR